MGSESGCRSEMRHRAAQMGADRAGYGEAFVAIAKDEDLLVHQKGGRAEGKIRRVADLECLRRLIKDARHEEPDNGSQGSPLPLKPRRRYLLRPN